MKKIAILFITLLLLISCSEDNNDFLKHEFFGEETGVQIIPSDISFGFSPQIVNFSSVLVNTINTKILTITNPSAFNIIINVTSIDNEITTNVNNFVIPANGTYNLTIKYSPLIPKDLNTSLVFSYGNNSSGVSIIGNAVTILPTTMSISPSGTLDFGNVAVGQSVSRNVILTNTGSAIANWTPIGNILTFNPLNGIIAIGASQQITLTFTASALGVYNNTQSIQYNGGSVQIPYTVNRIAATRILGVMCTTATAFGNVPVNTTVTKTITISNTGNSDLTVSQITISQAPQGQFTCSYSGVIAPNSSVNVPISFRPTAVGSKSCSIIVQSNKTSGSNSLSFGGFGI